MADAAKKRQSTVGAGALGTAEIVEVPRRKFSTVPDIADAEQATQPESLKTKSADTRKRATKPQKGQGGKKTRVSFHLSETLAERVRNTVYALSGPPHRLTMAKMAEEALEAACKKYQRDQNEGKPFPQREEDLVGGRQVK